MRTRIFPVARKEFREIRRDPITLWVAVVLPLMMLFLFGYAIRLDVEDVPMAVLDLDRSSESRALVEAFENTGDFSVRRIARDEREVGRLLDAGRVRLALIIPRGFARELAAGRAARVQTLIDGTFSATAQVIRNEVEAITAAFGQQERAGRDPAVGATPRGIRMEPRVWYNPALDSKTSIVPGLFAVILMSFPPLLTVLAVVREKESGSVEQIYVSPLRSWEFVAGKMLPYVVIAFGEVVMIVALGALWFQLPFRGSPSLLALGSILYVFCTVGIGLLVSTVTDSQVVAVLLALIITLMPSFLFSGFMYPIITMPELLQWYTRIFPARYYTDLSRGLFLKGSGLAELQGQLGTLAVYTALVFGAASVRFRKKIA